MVYRLPPLMELNAASRLLRGRPVLLVVGLCVELEKPWALERAVELLGGRERVGIVSVCPEAVHINMIGFKLAGMVARLRPETVAVLTTDGSMHCVQLHYVVEELEKLGVAGGGWRRRHLVASREGLVEVSPEAVRASRFLARVQRLLEERSSGGGGGG